MFRKLHFYDDFYLDDEFWRYISRKGSMKKRGLTKAIGEMLDYGRWSFNDSREVFMWNYDWCKSNGIVKSWYCSNGIRKTSILENIDIHWKNNVYFCEGDARIKVAEDLNNPFIRLAKDAYCFVDSSKNDYARFFFDEIDDECDGYAIEVSELFGFEMSKEEFGSRIAYTFKCLK